MLKRALITYFWYQHINLWVGLSASLYTFYQCNEDGVRIFLFWFLAGFSLKPFKNEELADVTRTYHENMDIFSIMLWLEQFSGVTHVFFGIVSRNVERVFAKQSSSRKIELS